MKIPPSGDKPPTNPFINFGAPRPPRAPESGIHPLALLGVLVAIGGGIASVLVLDWRWAVIGPLLGLALMFLGGFAAQRQRD